jgi:hypothetical protein
MREGCSCAAGSVDRCYVLAHVHIGIPVRPILYKPTSVTSLIAVLVPSQ